MTLTFKDVDEILKLIDEARYAEVRIEFSGLVLHVIREGAATSDLVPSTGWPSSVAPLGEPSAGLRSHGDESGAAAARPGPQPVAPGVPSALEVPAGMVAVRAPMAGTFYRAASPGAKPFVEVGTEVSVDDTVCLIEVMKLFKSVSGGAAGRVAAILVPDSAPVANQQPLMLIEPVRS